MARSWIILLILCTGLSRAPAGTATEAISPGVTAPGPVSRTGSPDETISPHPAPRSESVTLLKIEQVDSTDRTGTFLLRLLTGEKDTIRAMMRRPKGAGRRYPLAFLLVGIETGKDVVDLIEGHEDLVIFGMDYPFGGAFEFSGWSGFNTAMEIRAMAFRTIENTHAALDYLVSLPYVDTSNVTVVAVSFGVFTAVPAAVADHRVKRLAVVQAGGDMDKVIAENAERLKLPLPSWLAGKLGKILLSPFEPNDHIADFSPRPLILVTGEGDPFFPASSSRSFFEAAREPKEWIRHRSAHVMPDAGELIRELTRILTDKLYGGSGGG